MPEIAEESTRGNVMEEMRDFTSAKRNSIIEVLKASSDRPSDSSSTKMRTL